MLLIPTSSADDDSLLLPKETTTGNGLETSPSLLILLGLRIHDDTKGLDGHRFAVDPAAFRGILCARHGVLRWIIGNGMKIRRQEGWGIDPKCRADGTECYHRGGRGQGDEGRPSSPLPPHAGWMMVL